MICPQSSIILSVHFSGHEMKTKTFILVEMCMKNLRMAIYFVFQYRQEMDKKKSKIRLE